MSHHDFFYFVLYFRHIWYESRRPTTLHIWVGSLLGIVNSENKKIVQKNVCTYGWLQDYLVQRLKIKALLLLLRWVEASSNYEYKRFTGTFHFWRVSELNCFTLFSEFSWLWFAGFSSTPPWSNFRDPPRCQCVITRCMMADDEMRFIYLNK